MHRFFTKPSNKPTPVHQPASGDTEAKGQGRKRRNDRKQTLWIVCTALILCAVVAGCAFIDTAPKKSEEPPAQEPAVLEPDEESSDTTADDRDTAEEIQPATEEVYRPTREEVLSMREKALEGMSEEEIERLTENIKVANLQMESAYLNDNLFKKLSDKDSPYWLYFDQKGEIQLGWWYKQKIRSMDFIMKQENITEEEFYETYTEPGIVYNRFDVGNFIDLITDMQATVHNGELIADLQQLIDLTRLAQETHEMTYANEIYKILHDMDYFLLRYGIEDVGKYTTDSGTVGTYYGVLTIYQQNGEDQSRGEQIGVETAWQYLKDAFFATAELNEISYDEDGKLTVVVYRGEMEFSSGEEQRPCESIVFFDHQEADEYIFGNYMVFYDGKDVYALRTRGWYSVNAYTGEVTAK